MKNKKLLLIGFIILISVIFTAPSHASGKVFGNIGIYDYPWNISIGYNDYGRSYHKPRYVEHHHYYHKPRRHYYKKHYHHHRGHGYYKRYKRNHYHNYRGRYCPY